MIRRTACASYIRFPGPNCSMSHTLPPHARLIAASRHQSVPPPMPPALQSISYITTVPMPALSTRLFRWSLLDEYFIYHEICRRLNLSPRLGPILMMLYMFIFIDTNFIFAAEFERIWRAILYFMRHNDDIRHWMLNYNRYWWYAEWYIDKAKGWGSSVRTTPKRCFLPTKKLFWPAEMQQKCQYVPQFSPLPF